MEYTLEQVDFHPDAFPHFFCEWAEGHSSATSFLPRTSMQNLEEHDESSVNGSESFYDASFQNRWRTYLEDHDASEQTLENHDKLRQGDAVAVMTGQQPGLFGGPLYTVYKTATACAIANRLTENGQPAVPVFWNHSDDHNLSEIDRTYTLDRTNNLIEIALGLDHQNAHEIRSLSVEPETREALSFLSSALRETEFLEENIDLLTETRSNNPADWFSRLMHQLFADEGLLLFEPYLARPFWRGTLIDHLEHLDRDLEALRNAGSALADEGYKQPLQIGDASNLFYLNDGNRTLIEPEDASDREDWIQQIHETPEQFSPGAALRPLVQDRFFPVRTYVGGPGEITYHAQLSGLYEQHDVERPPLFPRLSLTIVEQKIEKVLQKFDLSYDRLLEIPAIKQDVLASAVPDSTLDVFEQTREEVESILEQLKQETLSIDSNLETPWEKTRDQVFQALRKYRENVEQSHRQKTEVGQKQLEKLEMNVFPRGKLQERVISPWHYFTLYSLELRDQFLNMADRSLDHPFTHHLAVL